MRLDPVVRKLKIYDQMRIEEKFWGDLWKRIKKGGPIQIPYFIFSLFFHSSNL